MEATENHVEAIHRGKLILSPKEIAKAYVETVTNKKKRIRDELTVINFKAMNVLRLLVLWMENKMQIP